MPSVSDSARHRGVRTLRWMVAVLAGVAVCLQTGVRSARPDTRHVHLVFQGNSAKSEAALRQAAEEELADFENRGQRRADLDNAAFRMEMAYRRDGYAFARVSFELTPSDAATKVVFTIEEGPQVRVDQIAIAGNEAVDRSTIESFLRGSQFVLFGQTGYPFVAAAIESAVQSIQDLYLSLGYLDVRIQAPEYSFHSDRHRVDIRIRIDEGRRYWVRQVAFTGDMPANLLPAWDEITRPLVHQPYHRGLDRILQARVREMFGDQGYPEAVIEVSAQMAEGPGAVDLTAAVVPGPLVAIQAIRILGLERTREDFVRRRLKIAPGDRFSQALKRESSAALIRSGVFSRCDIELEKTDEPGQQVLVVKVEESPSQEVYLQPGWGSYEQLMLKLGYRHSNLLGTALAWNTVLSASGKAQGGSSTLTDPWFLDTDIRADLTGFAEHREEPAFTRRDFGGSLFLTKDLKRNLRLTGGYTLRNTGLSDLGATREEEDVEQNYDFTSIKLQIAYDSRNDLFFPTSGQRLFTAVEQADTWLGGDVNFTRITLGARGYWRLTEQTVLGLRYDTGLIVPGRKNLTPPPAERFFNGGENTVRSFKEFDLGPTDSSGRPAGGLGVNVLNIELRQRLIGNFTGSIFGDLGNVSPNRTRFAEGESTYRTREQIISDTFSDFYRGLRPAVGFGFQYQLPVGPVRLDVGFNPDRERSRNEDLYVVHFSIGMAF